MKKAYSKPQIYFESFSLSQNIAAGCEITDPKDERLYFTGLGYAFSSSCDVPMTDAGGDGEYNGICYHVFSNNGAMNVHTS